MVDSVSGVVELVIYIVSLPAAGTERKVHIERLVYQAIGVERTCFAKVNLE